MNRRIVFALCIWVFAQLTMEAPAQPVIFTQPTGYTNVEPGSMVVLTVGATSTNSVVNYQWRLNGQDIPGETNAMLVYASVQATNGGRYDALLDDGYFAVASDPVLITVDVGPVITNNDFSSNAFLLSSAANSGVVRCSNVNATKQPNESTLVSGDPGGKSVWFMWAPTNSGTVTFTTQGSDFDTIMGEFPEFGLFRRTGPVVYGNDDGGGFFTSLLTFNVTTNSPYYIVVDGHYGASGDIVLSWNYKPLAPPVPTIQSSPPPLIVAELNQSLSLAVTNDIGSWLWLFNGQPTIDTKPNFGISSMSEANVGIYQVQVTSSGGTVRAPPTRLELSELEDGTIAYSSLAFNKFVDAVHGAYVQPPPVGNHVKTGGGDTRGYSVSQVFSTVGGTTEPGEPVVCAQPGGSPMWYAYVAPTNGTMEVDTSGSSFNTILGVFTGSGTSFASLTSIGCGYTTNRALNGQPAVYIPGIAQAQTNYIVVDGEHGTTGNVHLNIYLGAPVGIAQGMTNQTALPGSSVTFYVVATGSTPMNYAWQNQNGDLGDPNDLLTLTNLKSSDSGTYTVTINNAVSQASASAVLTVLTPPVITNQPADETVTAGAPASFTCGVAGTPPFAYRWFFQKSVVVGTNPTLSLTSVKSGNGGNYSCVITNAAGAVTSRVAILTVQMPPTITTQPNSRTVTSNTTATLNVVATGAPAPDYQWWFNNAMVGGDSNSLVVANFGAANQGGYVVVVSNAVGSVTSATATLLLDAPFRFGAVSFGGGAFHGELIGGVNSNYVLEASTDLVMWLPLLTNSSTNGYLDFLDTNRGGSRFYRGLGR